MDEVPDPEELTGSMHARVMTDRHFRHSKSRAFKFLGHLNADHAASRFKRDHIEDMPPK
jgi:hypothetical protein